MNTLSFDKEACKDFDWAIKREWIETNGIGGYASSTLIGANTSRYHGLLVAATQPPRARFVLLSHLEEVVFVGSKKYELSTNVYRDKVFPKGYNHLSKFLLSPFPSFIFQIDDILIEKNVFMIQGENSTVITYRLLSGDPEKIRLEVKPKLAYREFHSLGFENKELNSELKTQVGVVSLSPYSELPPIYFYHNSVILDKSFSWFNHAQLVGEKERGSESEEDLFQPCSFIYSFLNESEVYLLATTKKKKELNLKRIRLVEEARREQDEIPEEISNPAIRQLWRNSRSFIVTAKDGLKRVIAGYPRFEDWGRDTFIALPGLTLSTGRIEEAKELLLAYTRYVSQGMIPNYFPDHSETPDYHSVDASLWFVNAVYEYYQLTEDDLTVSKKLYPAMKKIIKFYIEGARDDIKMDQDFLLKAGNKHTRLTWMDAAVGNEPVTSRYGKTVEVNALWYNALKIMEFFSNLLKDEKESGVYRDFAFNTKENFNERFWNRKETCLYDVVGEKENDDTIRPNQVFSISLPFPVLSTSRWKPVMKKIDEHLLTPYGLRSLSPEDPRYKGVYIGDVFERDRIYHQGCVFPWLMGAYIFGSLRAYGRTKTIKRRMLKQLDAILEHLEDAGLGYISEVFDGNKIHYPRGGAAQATSVAEVLRAYVELVKDELKVEKAREVVLK